MINFFETQKALKSEDIKEAETFSGLIFPDEYKAHLLKYNGGYCEPNIFSFYENGKKTHSILDWFLSICEGEYNNLFEYVKIYKLNEKRLPENLLPIARDPLGNLICISCFGDNFGHIYFWDHEKEYEATGQINYDNKILVAKDLEEFLDGLMQEAN